MKKSRLITSGLLTSFLLLTACYPAPQPIHAADPWKPGQVSLPTPAAPGFQVISGELQLEVRRAEITVGYMTEFGSQREPPRGEKFLWVQVLVKNTGQREQNLPAPEHFSALYGKTEFKPSYGHRQGHLDYTTVKPVIYPGQKIDAWLRFQLPAAAELSEIQLAFLPESYQISTAFSPGEYPWGAHPLYLWKCLP